MRLLLDTHALLWWLGDNARLGPAARDLIADPATDVMVSTVSLWEIVVKVRVGKLEADIEDVTTAIGRDGFSVLQITAAHLTALDGLPRHPDHRDPFDHLLIAQAISEGAAFLSEDRKEIIPLKQVTQPNRALPASLFLPYYRGFTTHTCFSSARWSISHPCALANSYARSLASSFEMPGGKNRLKSS